jgi:hypothetical protein
MICHILDYLTGKGVKNFKIAITSEYIDNFISVTKRFSRMAFITFVEADGTKSPVETVKLLARNIPLECPVLLNLGDTYCEWDFQEFEKNDVAILVDRVADSERWTTVTLSPNGKVESIFEKQVERSNSLGVCGVYWWRRAKDLLMSIEDLPVDAEISFLLSVAERTVAGVAPQLWIDADRQDILENSRLTMVQSRSFNSIQVDLFRGSLTKSSTNVLKLNKEIQFYSDLPEDLKIFFPRMLKYEISEVKPWQELEYYSYPTLSEIYCFEDAPKFIWERIFHKLGRITFEAFSAHNSDFSEITLASIFIEKCRSRFTDLVRTSAFSQELLMSPSLMINGKGYPGVGEILDMAEPIVETMVSDLHVMHGDFCLSNILCDINSTNIKLIDPRGGFELSSCFGPQIYDVAKLGHSVIGRYDLIMADLFTVQRYGSRPFEFAMEVFSRESHEMIENAFISHYLKGRYEDRIVRLLSGLILLSIPSMHLERPDRALALFLQGVQITSRAIEEFR